MFQKIQNSLLLKHPLLWNIKIVPVLAATVFFHIIFFIIGYVDGAIDFTTIERWDYSSTPALVTFFAVLLAILLFIVWMVFYFRNNAYKSFYPQRSSSLYKEWLLILLVCLFNCTYSASYLYAKDLRARNYFSEEEFSRRIDIISMASLFADGGFREDGREYVDDETGWIQKDSFEFNNRQYHLESLLNKTITNFSYQGRIKDSLNEVRVKMWLAENRKDSVLWVMNEFDKISKSHNLKSNITPKQWFDKIYNYPEFTDYITVGRVENYEEGSTDHYSYNEYETEVVVAADDETELDTASFYVKTIKGQRHIFSRYHVPLSQLDKSYSKISSSWYSPDIDFESLSFYLYFSLCLSLAIFSFRVTSGRNWLIALISLGVLAMLTGIMSVAIYSGLLYPISWFVIIICLFIYFISKYIIKTEKSISGIVLNGVLWLMPWLLPILYVIILDIVKDINHPDGYNSSIPTPFEDWLEAYGMVMMYVNAALYVVYMYFFTGVIKKWKGIAEA